MKTPPALSDYASEDEIAQAIAELQARAKALSVELREARAEARKVHPLFDFRARSRNGKSAARAVKQSLSKDARDVVTRAERLAEHRDTATRAANYLSWIGADLARATIVAATADGVSGTNCPVFRSIIGRWQTALEENGEKMMSAKEAGKLAAHEAKVNDLLRRIEKLRGGRA